MCCGVFSVRVNQSNRHLSMRRSRSGSVATLYSASKSETSLRSGFLIGLRYERRVGDVFDVRDQSVGCEDVECFSVAGALHAGCGHVLHGTTSEDDCVVDGFALHLVIGGGVSYFGSNCCSSEFSPPALSDLDIKCHELRQLVLAFATVGEQFKPTSATKIGLQVLPPKGLADP